MEIRESSPSDIKDIMDVETIAFGYEKEAFLTKDLLEDETARPYLSLLAFDGDDPVGHILFTKARLDPERSDISFYLLAPLAVIPEYQGKGVGGELIRTGLKILKEKGADLVFVLGHTEYYPKFDFLPAGVRGFDAPYPIPEIHSDAWMVQELRSGMIGSVKGKIICASALNRPEHWR